MFDVARTEPPPTVPAKKPRRLPRLGGTAIPWGRVVGLLRALGTAKRRPKPAAKEQEASPPSTSGDGEQTAVVVQQASRPRGRFALTRHLASLIGAALGATAFAVLSPQTAPFLGILAILSAPEKLPKAIRPRHFVLPVEITRTLRPFSTPAMGLGILRVLLPVAAPAVWRGVSYWHVLHPPNRPPSPQPGPSIRTCVSHGLPLNAALPLYA